MNTTLSSTGEPIQPPLKIWWLLCGAFLVSLGMAWAVAAFLPLPVLAPQTNPFVNLIGLVPLFISIVVRWLALPRYTDATKAFPMFVAGLALAEICGLVALFTGGPYRDDLAVLAVLGILQFMPLFVRRLGEQQQPGFRPNN